MATTLSAIAPGSQQTQAPNFHPLSPTYFLVRAAEIEPEAPAIYHVNRDQTLLWRTYQQFSDRAKGLAYFLRARGCRRVGILASNSPAFLEAIYGISGAGGVNVAINYRLNSETITYIFTHADVDTIIVDEEYVPLLDNFRCNNPDVIIVVDNDKDSAGPFDLAIQEGLNIDSQGGSKGWNGLTVHPESENDLIALAYTSGTTALPKGVEYLHRGAYLGSIAAVAEHSLADDKNRCRFLWTLPIFHAMGWCFVWAVSAARGIHYCLRTIDYPRIWNLLKDEGITHFCAAPTVNTLLCNDKEAKRLSARVKVMVAGSPPTAHLFEQMEALNLHPVHVYGMTETYGPITICYRSPLWDKLQQEQVYQRSARQGHALIASREARVVKQTTAEGELANVQPNGLEIGEVVFVGNLCANGYYKNAEETQRLFAWGVLHSGDLAVQHPDGSIQIMDRSKDMIISGGENISSIALESLIVTHPDILEAGVVAVPDAKWGERPKAFVTLRDEKRQATSQSILEWIKNHASITNFMVPREVEIVEGLPKTNTGKIQKQILRQWVKGAAMSKL